MKAQPFQHFTLIACLLGAAALAGCDNRTAEEKGADMANEKIGLVGGVGKVLEEKGKATGESIVGGIGQLGRGAEAGLAKTVRTGIDTDPSIKLAGLDITKVQPAAVTEKHKNGLDAYVTSSADTNGKLRAIVYDATGQEVGRATVQLTQAADNAGYHHFELPEQIALSNVTKVKFDFKPGAAPAEQK